jgi:hypothetical protein
VLTPTEDDDGFGAVEVLAGFLTWLAIAVAGGLLAWGALLLLGWLWS